MTHKVAISQQGLFTQNFRGDVIFVRNMQANYVYNKCTFIVGKTLPQILLILSQSTLYLRLCVYTVNLI